MLLACWQRPNTLGWSSWCRDWEAQPADARVSPGATSEDSKASNTSCNRFFFCVFG